MLELGAGADILRAVSSLYLVLIVVLVVLALWLPKRGWQKALGVVAVLLVTVGPAIKRNQEEMQQVDERKVRYEKAKALFDGRCKTAGEKIYRTVDGVQSIKLINPRQKKVQGVDEVDQNWQGAGIPKESTGEQYILNFLFYDVPSEGKAIRHLDPGGTEGPYGSIAAGIGPKGIKGYQYVEVEENGAWVQYSLKELTAAIPPEGFGRYGKRELATRPSPTYAVVYENIADPEGRSNWIAGARVTVMDQRSGELLGELVQYSFEAGFGSTAGFRQPWAFAQRCPSPAPSTTEEGTVRFFAQKILKPIQGN